MSNFQLDNKKALILLCLLVVTFVCFFPALKNSFVNWDDDLIFGNPLVLNLNGPNIVRLFTSSFDGRYYPLALMTHQLEYHFFKFNASLYHLTNVILHLINIVLVFYILSLLNINPAVVMFVTFLFAVHPMQVESVAWISGRKDLLAGFFFLLAIYFYLKLKDHGPTKSKYVVLTFISFLLSLFAKPMAIMFPIVLVTIDAYVGAVKREDFTNKWPFFLVSFIFSYITVAVAQFYFPARFLYTKVDGILFSFYSLILYAAKLVVPFRLSCLYPLPGEGGLPYPFLLYLSPFLVSLIWFMIKKFKNKNLKLLFVFFVIMLFPVLHLIRINNSLLYDRFVYIPSISIYLILGHVLRILFQKIFNKSRIGRIIFLVVVLSYLSYVASYAWIRCHVWRDGMTLWQDVLRKFPHSAIAHVNRGDVYSATGEFDLALFDFSAAIELAPYYALAYYNRAGIYEKFGLSERAIQDYSHALKFDPWDVKSYNNRGNLFSDKGDYSLALEDYNKVLLLDPKNVYALLNRGLVYYKMNNLRKAADDFSAVLRKFPNNDYARNMQTMVLKKIKDASKNEK